MSNVSSSKRDFSPFRNCNYSNMKQEELRKRSAKRLRVTQEGNILEETL